MISEPTRGTNGLEWTQLITPRGQGHKGNTKYETVHRPFGVPFILELTSAPLTHETEQEPEHEGFGQVTASRLRQSQHGRPM